MDPGALKPDPDHIPWLKELFLIVAGALLASWKTIFRRHVDKEDSHSAVLADLMTRVTVIEGRPASITVTELDLAIERALSRAKDLFTPQHEELAKKAERAIEQSELETRQLVTECNAAIRRDLGGSIDRLREDVVPALNAVTTALQQSHELMRQYTGLIERVAEALGKAGLNRRGKR